MGIKGLKSYIQCCIRYNHLSEYKGKSMAVDVSIFLYKFKYGGNYINSFKYQLKKFEKFGITPIYVFDGKPNSLKSNVLEKRKCHYDKLNDKLSKLTDSQEIKNIQKQIIKIEPEDTENVKDFFRKNDVIYIDGIDGFDAEGICSYMNKHGYVDCVVSEDIDVLTYGGIELISKFNNKTDEVESILLCDVLEYLNITYNDFVKMCVISGCDFHEGKYGFGPSRSHKQLSKIADTDLINSDVSYSDIMSIFTCIDLPENKLALIIKK